MPEVPAGSYGNVRPAYSAVPTGCYPSFDGVPYVGERQKCPRFTKRETPCKAPANGSGFCVGHERTVAAEARASAASEADS